MYRSNLIGQDPLTQRSSFLEFLIHQRLFHYPNFSSRLIATAEVYIGPDHGITTPF